MPETNTKTTIDYQVDEFTELVKKSLFPGKDAKIRFVVQEVGGDVMDQFPGTPQVTAIKIEFPKDTQMSFRDNLKKFNGSQANKLKPSEMGAKLHCAKFCQLAMINNA